MVGVRGGAVAFLVSRMLQGLQFRTWVTTCVARAISVTRVVFRWQEVSVAVILELLLCLD